MDFQFAGIFVLLFQKVLQIWNLCIIILPSLTRIFHFCLWMNEWMIFSVDKFDKCHGYETWSRKCWSPIIMWRVSLSVTFEDLMISILRCYVGKEYHNNAYWRHNIGTRHVWGIEINSPNVKTTPRSNQMMSLSVSSSNG